MLFDKQDHIKIPFQVMDYFEQLTDKEIGLVMNDICAYCFTGKQSALTGKAYEAWEYLKTCADFQEKHPRWRGGAIDDSAVQRRSTEYKMWRDEVFSRDDYTCQICGKRGGKLNAHHIKHFATHSELRTTVSNGITLCTDCHKAVHRRDLECPTGS